MELKLPSAFYTARHFGIGMSGLYALALMVYLQCFGLVMRPVKGKCGTGILKGLERRILAVIARNVIQGTLDTAPICALHYQPLIEVYLQENIYLEEQSILL
jgi:hypothetical protein